MAVNAVRTRPAPDITGRPPREVASELKALDVLLDAAIPPKTLDRNLLVATWNIRAFGGMTPRWRSGSDDTPARDLGSVRAIAEIVDRFDVIALQEVRGDLRALRHMLKALGPHWGVMMTDVGKGKEGNDERLAFAYDTRRVRPSGLAAELVVPERWRGKVRPGALTRQFARTPYAVSFVAGDKTFILVTMHVLYGKSPKDRVGELRGIAEWLANWAEDLFSWHHNLLVLGDFNIDRLNDPLYQAFTSTGLEVPKQLHDIPRTIFGSDTGHFYDQIAWFGEASERKLTLRYTERAGTVDFPQVLLPHLSRAELSWRISDHYPLWVEFSTRE